MYSLSAIGVETSPICLFSFQLDQSGVYQFKVKVTGQNKAYGYAFINVTVLPGETLFVVGVVVVVFSCKVCQNKHYVFKIYQHRCPFSRAELLVFPVKVTILRAELSSYKHVHQCNSYAMLLDL